MVYLQFFYYYFHLFFVIFLLIFTEKLIYFSVFSPKHSSPPSNSLASSFIMKWPSWRKIMKNNWNIFCYFVIHITLIMSSSSVFTSKMTITFLSFFVNSFLHTWQRFWISYDLFSSSVKGIISFFSSILFFQHVLLKFYKTPS